MFVSQVCVHASYTIAFNKNYVQMEWWVDEANEKG